MMYGAALKSQETRRIKKPDKGDLAGSKSFLLQVSEREAEKEKEREAGNSPSEAGDYERGMSSREASPSTQNNAAEDKGQKAFATATKMRSVIGAFAADQKGSAARKKWLSAITKVNAARAFKSKSRVIDPQSTGRVTWDLVLGIPILYSVLIIPYRLGFDHEATGFFYWLDISIDSYSKEAAEDTQAKRNELGQFIRTLGNIKVGIQSVACMEEMGMTVDDHDIAAFRFYSSMESFEEACKSKDLHPGLHRDRIALINVRGG